MGIKIITDSTCDLELDKAAAMGVEVAPLGVTIDGETFIDKHTISSSQFYAKLKTAKDVPVTTLVSPQSFIDIFNKYPEDTIIGIFVSSKFSGTFQSAVIARADTGREDIHLIDSGTVTGGLTLLLDQASKLVAAGCSAEEIVRKIIELSAKVEIYAVLDTLKYLVKGGRLSGAQGAIGGLLGVKPILRVKDGAIFNVGKERGFQRGLDTAKKLVDQNSKLDTNMPICYLHSNASNNILSISTAFGQLPGSTICLGSVVGTHAGPGALGIAFFNE